MLKLQIIVGSTREGRHAGDVLKAARVKQLPPARFRLRPETTR